MFSHSHRFAEETRSSFICAHSPDGELRDQVVLPVIERSDFQDNATLLICHPVSSHVKIIKEKSESTDRGASTQQDSLVSGNSTQNEIKDGVSPGSQVNISCADQHTDGSKLCQQRELQTTDRSNIQSILCSAANRQESGFHACKLENLLEKGIDAIVKSEQVLGLSAGQQSSREQEQNSQVTKVNWNNGGCGEGSSQGKQKTNKLLQLSFNTTAAEKKVQENGPLPLDVNNRTSVTDQVEGCHPVKNLQSLVEHETDVDDKLVGTGGSEEPFLNAAHKADIQNRHFAQLGQGGVLLIPSSNSLDNTSTGKHNRSYHL